MLPIQTALVPFDLSQVFPSEPVPFDLFNNHGVLILRRGSWIEDPGKRARLDKMHLYRFGREQTATHSSPVVKLEGLAKRYSAITTAEVDASPAQWVELADQLYQVTMDHPSVCLGMMRHIKLTSAARAKALFAAILGCVVAARVGFDRPMQRTLILAGITMNLASFELQDQLHAEARVPTAEECEELWLHPQQSADRLFKAGVRDTDWLNVVLQHHENLDRSGYPDKIGVEAVMPEARILRVADVFSAMVEGRPNRVGYAPRQAMQMTLERERGRLDDSVMLTLRRVIGHYPPGTLVKLANRETAIVTRWFGNAEGPRFVVSFLRPSGNPMLQPRVRSTSSTGNAIRGYATMPAPAPSLDWSSVWAQG